MLVLSRKPGEKIVIGHGITVSVNRVSGNRVAIGIEAPDSMRIVRGELLKVVDSFQEHPAEDSARQDYVGAASHSYCELAESS